MAEFYCQMFYQIFTYSNNNNNTNNNNDDDNNNNKSFVTIDRLARLD